MMAQRNFSCMHADRQGRVSNDQSWKLPAPAAAHHVRSAAPVPSTQIAAQQPECAAPPQAKVSLVLAFAQPRQCLVSTSAFARHAARCALCWQLLARPRLPAGLEGRHVPRFGDAGSPGASGLDRAQVHPLQPAMETKQTKSPPRSARKRPHSPDRERTTSREADPPAYMHGDPRVEGLSQLSDIMTMSGSPKGG